MFNAVFEQVEELLPGLNQLGEVKRLARLLEGLLLSHAKVEGDLLILAQGRVGEGKRRYDHCRHEHEEIDSRLTRVHSARNLPGARALLRGAIAASRKHFKHEERRVFPRLEEDIQPEALTKLGTVWFLQRYAPPRWTV
jgi:hypothetical protein